MRFFLFGPFQLTLLRPLATPLYFFLFLLIYFYAPPSNAQIQTRVVECRDSGGVTVADSFCSATTRPPETQTCPTPPPPVTPAPIACYQLQDCGIAGCDTTIIASGPYTTNIDYSLCSLFVAFAPGCTDNPSYTYFRTVYTTDADASSCPAAPGPWRAGGYFDTAACDSFNDDTIIFPYSCSAASRSIMFSAGNIERSSVAQFGTCMDQMDFDTALYNSTWTGGPCDGGGSGTNYCHIDVTSTTGNTSRTVNIIRLSDGVTVFTRVLTATWVQYYEYFISPSECPDPL